MRDPYLLWTARSRSLRDRRSWRTAAPVALR